MSKKCGLRIYLRLRGDCFQLVFWGFMQVFARRPFFIYYNIESIHTPCLSVTTSLDHGHINCQCSYFSSVVERSFLVFVIVFMSLPLWTQPSNDNVLWSGFRFRTQLSSDYSLQIQPFFRFNEDFGGYQNTSIDISLRRNLGSHWYVQILSRTWFIPDDIRNQQFVWMDIGLRTKFENLGLNMNNSLRWHNALIDGTVLNRDFIRYKLAFTPDNDWKFKPTFAVEPWFQLNGVNDFERYRIEPGFVYSFTSDLSFVFVWRRQNHILPKFQQNFWLVLMSKVF